jgi:hypothetical protein
MEIDVREHRIARSPCRLHTVFIAPALARVAVLRERNSRCVILAMRPGGSHDKASRDPPGTIRGDRKAPGASSDACSLPASG